MQFATTARQAVGEIRVRAPDDQVSDERFNLGVRNATGLAVGEIVVRAARNHGPKHLVRVSSTADFNAPVTIALRAGKSVAVACDDRRRDQARGREILPGGSGGNGRGAGSDRLPAR